MTKEHNHPKSPKHNTKKFKTTKKNKIMEEEQNLTTEIVVENEKQPKKVVKSSTNATLSNVEQKNVSKEANSYDILMRAIELNVDLDAFEKLVNLVEKVQIDKAKREFYEAFAKFQSQVPPILKLSEVNMGAGRPRYNYASLYDIISKIQKPLGEANLSFRWEILNNNDIIEVTCILSHSGGYELQTSIQAGKDATPGKSNVQAIASTITYLKRYTLVSLLGIGTADPDDDAQATVNFDKKKDIEGKDKIIEQIKNELKNCKDEDGVKRIWSKYQKYSSDKDILQVFTDWRKTQTNEKINKTNNIKIQKGELENGDLQL